VNGVHDLGGLQDMGPVQREKNEPVFHSVWEGRIYAINAALRAIGKWNLDAWRYQIELIPPADYFQLSYYERWLRCNERLLISHGLITAQELATGVSDSASTKGVTALSAIQASGRLGRGIPSSKDPSIQAAHKAGDLVRTRNMNPTGHTRLPRYARGKAGTIGRDHGVYSFPDTNAHFQGPKRQHVYSVRFSARELWGEAASVRDSVHLDLWEDYLERA
jgi:nitrile hydratase beta subunit